MAATAPAIDLSVPSSFNLRLGPSILKQNDGQRYRNVRYNYKPRAAQGATVNSKILPGGQPGACTLSLKDGDKEWKYKGQHKEEEDQYILVIGGEGKNEVVLERLGTSHAVNLTQTPEDNDEESLARRHPHITDNESDNDENDIFGDPGNIEDAMPDADNPFDFRHFLKAVEEVPQREESTPQQTRSTIGTPAHGAITSTPVSRPAKPTPAKPATSSAALKKRKTPSAAATKSNPKRVKAGEDLPVTDTPTTSVTSKAADPAVPQLRLDRKASTHRTKVPEPHVEEPDYEDDGELILENSTAEDTSQNPNHLSAMSLAISGALGNRGSGPISLRSAASSPGVNSPHMDSSVAQGNQEGQEFDFGGGSSPAGQQYEFEFVDDDGDDDDDDGGEGDNDQAEAQSANQSDQPHQSTLPPRSRRGSLAGQVGDEEDDMEAQLALAMAAEEDDEEPVGGFEDSDEDVSEEE